jgi:uncharacterized protein (TIGR02217 family)
MSFSESVLPVDVAPSTASAINFATTVKRLRGGGEYRNRLWQHPLRTFQVRYSHRERADIETEILSFALERAGAFEGFRARDWSDYTATDEVIGSGDTVETAFALTKLYGSYSRRILKPLSTGISVYLDGVLESPSNYTLDSVNGGVTFDTAPGSGVEITWTGEFHVPVRFTTDALSVIMSTQNMGHLPQFELQELRLNDAF